MSGTAGDTEISLKIWSLTKKELTITIVVIIVAVAVINKYTLNCKKVE